MLAVQLEIRFCNAVGVDHVVVHSRSRPSVRAVSRPRSDCVTTLSFSQPELDPVDGASIGPGWEYYLDRMVAAEAGGDVAAIDFERDYFPAMADYYRSQL